MDVPRRPESVAPMDVPRRPESVAPMPAATRYFDLPSPFPMKRGAALLGARLAYETWGTLSASGDNAIFILTGLSPSAHRRTARLLAASAKPADPK